MSDDQKKPRIYRVQKTRRSVWKDEEVFKVISVWKKRIFELRQTKKNKHIYAEIAEELNEMGMDTICEEVHTKIQNLSQLYRSEKRRLDQNGGPTSEWPYFTAVEDVLLSVEGLERSHDDSMKFHDISSYSATAADVVSVNDTGSESDSDSDDYSHSEQTNGNHNHMNVNYMTDYVGNNQQSNPKTYEFAKNYVSPSASIASSSQSNRTSNHTARKSLSTTNYVAAFNNKREATTNYAATFNNKKEAIPNETNLHSEILNEIKRANALADLEREETSFLHKEMKDLEQQRFNLTQIFIEKSLSLQKQMLACLQVNSGIRTAQQLIPSSPAKKKR